MQAVEKKKIGEKRPAGGKPVTLASKKLRGIDVYLSLLKNPLLKAILSKVLIGNRLPGFGWKVRRGGRLYEVHGPQEDLLEAVEDALYKEIVEEGNDGHKESWYLKHAEYRAKDYIRKCRRVWRKEISIEKVTGQRLDAERKEDRPDLFEDIGSAVAFRRHPDLPRKPRTRRRIPEKWIDLSVLFEMGLGEYAYSILDRYLCDTLLPYYASVRVYADCEPSELQKLIRFVSEHHVVRAVRQLKQVKCQVLTVFSSHRRQNRYRKEDSLELDDEVSKSRLEFHDKRLEACKEEGLKNVRETEREKRWQAVKKTPIFGKTQLRIIKKVRALGSEDRDLEAVREELEMGLSVFDREIRNIKRRSLGILWKTFVAPSDVVWGTMELQALCPEKLEKVLQWILDAPKIFERYRPSEFPQQVKEVAPTRGMLFVGGERLASESERLRQAIDDPKWGRPLWIVKDMRGRDCVSFMKDNQREMEKMRNTKTRLKKEEWEMLKEERRILKEIQEELAE